MTKSKEFTDLNFVAPRAQAYGRPNGEVIWNVIHTTEGSYHAQSAEDGAAYDARRTDSVSTHFFVDNNSVVQCVYTWDRAYTARTIPNNRGIHYELCGRAAWSQATWLNDYGKSMLENAARIAASVSKKYGIPARWITDDQMRNREKGFTTHAQCTRILGGSHTDPGSGFPFDYFMSRVKYYLGESYSGGLAIAGEVEVEMDNNTIFNVDLNGDGKLEPKRYADVIGWLVGKQHETTKALTALKAAAGVDEAKLAASLAENLKVTTGAAVNQADLEAALKKVLGSLG